LDQLPAHHHQGYLRAGDHRIHVQIFQPLTQAQGTVWVLHGYLEHSGLYQPMIAELLAQNFAVLTLDLPGHGLSSGEETGISEFSVYQSMLKDIHTWVTQQAVAALPKPWVGIGQSTGCAIWMDHVLQFSSRRHTPIIERLFLISPLVRPAKSGWWQNPIGLSLIQQIKHSIPRKFRRNNSNPEYLRFVRLQDPLQPRIMAMSWILALSRWMPYMEALPASRFPVWLVQGMRDQTVNWRYNNAFVLRKFRLKVALILEDASHQLVNECQEIRAPMTALIPVFLKGD
jgi:alpha-beta hydrolase superfamily lysophospholipase